MLKNLLRSVRGFWLLRHPELRRRLTQFLENERLVSELRRRHPTTCLASELVIVGYRPELLQVESRASICAGTVLAFGDDTNGFGEIHIGAGTWIGQYNNLRASGHAVIRVGADCLISQFCTLVGSNHAIGRSRSIITQGPETGRLGVTLEDDIWLGAGVTVLPGIHISRGAVIGANSVVTRDVAPYEIWAGCPARKIGERADV